MTINRREILRATSIFGSVSVANLLIGVARTKVAAMLLGPAGVGLVGLFHNIIQTASTLVAFGIGNVGTRQIAEAADDPQRSAAARRAISVAALVLGLVGGVLLFVLREPVALLLLQRPEWKDEIGWLSLGVALTIGGVAQHGMLTGLRQVGLLARVSILSALIGSAVGVGLLLLWGDKALLAFVLVSPLATFLVGSYYLRRAPRPAPRQALGLSDLKPQWKVLASLGLAFSLAALVTHGGQLLVRSLVQRELGLEQLGHYQAAWSISMNYIAVVLSAMASEYYPRLTATLSDPEHARRTIDHQIELAMLLAGPLLVGTVACAPWILQLLYSSEFLPSVTALRWQIMGDYFKIPLWAIGFVLLAAGRGKTFVANEAFAALLLVGTTALLLPRMGLEAPGAAYLVMNFLYLALLLWLARRLIGFWPERSTILIFLSVGLSLVICLLVLAWSELAGAAVGVTLAVMLGMHGLVRFGDALPAPVAAVVARLPLIGRARGSKG